MLLYGIMATLPCLAMLLWPHRQARFVEKRMAEGDNRFFEEQRTYESYPWMRDPKRIRIVGAVGTLSGIIFCVMQLYR